jgi:hypothetical protein
MNSPITNGNFSPVSVHSFPPKYLLLFLPSIHLNRGKTLHPDIMGIQYLSCIW